MPIGYSIIQLATVIRDKLADFSINKDAHFELEESIYMDPNGDE